MASDPTSNSDFYMRLPSGATAYLDPHQRPPLNCSPGLPYFNPQLPSPAGNVKCSRPGDSAPNEGEYANEVYEESLVRELEERFAFRSNLAAASVLGVPDLFNAEVWRAAISEFVATAMLVFVSTAGAITGLQANLTSSAAAVALIEFLSISFVILAAAPASGCHLNPAITIAAMLTGFSSPVKTLLYVVGQSAGAAVGAAALKVVVASDVADKYSLGGCLLRNNITVDGVQVEVGISTGYGLLSEFMFTLTLLYVAFSVALDPKQFQATGPILAPFMIGAVMALLGFNSSGLMAISGGYTGAGMNPARCFGVAAARGGILWRDHWVFWVGPMLSATALSIIYHLIPPDHVELYRSRKDIFTKIPSLYRAMSSATPISNKKLTHNNLNSQ